MYKLTYLLTLPTPGQYPSPIAVSGRGRTYGFAEYDTKLNAHVYRVAQKDWEGDMARDVAENRARFMGRWVITAEVDEYDPDSEVGKMAVELDKVKSENDRLTAHNETLRAALQKYVPAASSAEDDAEVTRLLATAEPGDVPPASETPTEERGEFASMGFRATRKVATGLGCNVEGMSKKTELIAAIEAKRADLAQAKE